MNQEQEQNITWSSLPQSAKERILRTYNYACEHHTAEYWFGVYNELCEMFGEHNLKPQPTVLQAKVKATGQVIAVTKTMDAQYKDVLTYGVDERCYYESELEIAPIEDGSKVIDAWLCCDKDGALSIFYNCDMPKVDEGYDFWSVTYGADFGYIPKDMFPDITFENSPRRIKITIAPVKK